MGWDRSDLMDRIPSLTPQALSNLIRRDSKRSEWDTEIAAALGVSVLWLVYGIDAEYAKHDTTVLTLREADAGPLNRLMQTAATLPRDDLLILIGRAEEMATRAKSQRKTAS
jgi:hypothetical protein